MTSITIAQIVAIASGSRAIGKDNELLWHVPADLKHFKQTTMGKPIIMGRKTYDSVGFPLPGRTNIVVSRDASLQIEGVLLVGSCEEAIKVGLRCCEEQSCPELIIAGGEEIYRQTLAQTDKVYLSEIEVEVEGDAFYPELLGADWKQDSKEAISHGDTDEVFILKTMLRR